MPHAPHWPAKVARISEASGRLEAPQATSS
jgi:hypothetical protein